METPLWQKAKRNLRASWWKWKGKWKSWLKTQHSKTKIMASGPITPWQIDGEAMDSDRLYFRGFQNHCQWWRPGKPSIVQSMRSQRVGHDLVTEQQQHYNQIFKDQRIRILKSPREVLTHKGILIRLSVEFSKEIFQAINFKDFTEGGRC